MLSSSVAEGRARRYATQRPRCLHLSQVYLGSVSFPTEQFGHDVLCNVCKCRIDAFLGANAGAENVTDRNPAGTPAPLLQGQAPALEPTFGAPGTGQKALGRGPLRQLRKAKMDVILSSRGFLSTDLYHLGTLRA